MSEFIGSRISLISRSDIRYVGTLHQIDSENSTVGLENVTNHGTEGRCDDPANEVDGTDEIYDYIVFRGSDVKDLRMEAPEAAPKPPPPQPSFPNDPAIINAQRPPGYPHPQALNYQQNGRPGPNQPPFNPNFAPGFYPPPGPMGGPRAGPGGQFYPQPPPYMAGFPGGPGGLGFPAGPFPYGVPPFPPGPQVPGQAPPPGDNRNRAAPQPGAQPQSAPAPTQAKVELPVTTAENKDTAPEPKGATPTQQPPPPPLESKPDVATALAQPTAVTSAQPTGPRNAGTRGRGARGRGAFGSSQPGHTQTGTTITTTTTTITPAAPIVQPAPAPVQPALDSPGLADLERKVQAMKLKQTNGTNQQYRQNNNGPPQYRGRGRGRGGVPYSLPHQPRKVNVPTTDYDFELANARFTKVADGEDGASATDAPEGSVERKPSVDQPAIIAPAGGFYNKGSSFFDNISCENKERAEAKEIGADGRPGVHRRSEEVRKNIETFGQGSVDSGYRRGNWRGRGGRGRGHYRGRGRGGGQQQQQQQQHQQQTQPQSQSQPVKASS
ncbi:hypothetical protein TWF506_001398 [Arthrobotrys conoides]|uniref:FFD box profile domain-containing protein n=1 Tax=Arthrobotrys conoides TaxID=74498 RepID=A0AAN8P204_9PEZI